MSAAMRTELREHKHRVYETLEFTIAGTTFRYSTAKGGAIRLDGGHFLPGLLSRGPIPRTLSWPSYGLAEPRVTFQIYDEDRSLQKHHGGPMQGQARGGTVDLDWRSEFVTSANHFNVFSGEIKDFRMPQERTFELVAGPDDSALRSELKIKPLSRSIWPKIPQKNEDAQGVVHLGNWLSLGVPEAAGMVEAVLVDDVTGVWYVSSAIMGDISNIQVNGVSDSDWTIKGTGAAALGPFVQAGRPYTILQDTASTLRTIADTVTCDVVGPEIQGDGSEATALLDKPANMLRIALANFAFNDWPVGAPTPTSGSWGWFSQTVEDANTPIDADSNDDADSDFFDAHGITAAMLLTSDDTGLDILRTWAESFRCPIAWELPFEIVTRPIILNPRSPYPAEVISKFLRDIKKAEEQTQGSHVVTAHKTTYIFNSADGSFAKQRLDGNRFCEGKIETPFEFTYGPAESVT